MLDPDAAGLVPSWQWRQQHRTTASSDPSADADVESRREAKRAERRTVIANNKAWDSATTVRHEWLAKFATRKTAPEGAEQLITDAVLVSDFTLGRAMTGNHQLLRTWLGLDPHTWQSPDQLPAYLARVSTSKRHTMIVLAAVLAGWEEGLSRESWRRPNPRNSQVLNAITTWGYQPSTVEHLIITITTLDEDYPRHDTADPIDHDANDDGENEIGTA